jgi:hypothetical protein
LARGATPDLRDRARAALEQLGHPPDARAERLPPGDWLRLAGLLDGDLLEGLGERSGLV